MRIRRIIAAFVMMAGIGLVCFSGARLYDANQVYREGDASYAELSGRVRRVPDIDAIPSPSSQSQPRYDPAGAENTEGSEGADGERSPGGLPSTLVYVPPMEIDFEALKEINNDAVAWLYCPDTVVDYPVLEAMNYSYYLSRLPDGAKNANGSLFIDFNNAPDFNDALTVVYGHNMKSGAMFGSLDGYKSQKYFDEHPFIYLYTEQGSFCIELMYGCVIGAGQWRERAFMYQENLGSLLAYAEYNTTFESSIRFKDGDRAVALATCSYEFNDARYVVIGILRVGDYKVEYDNTKAQG